MNKSIEKILLFFTCPRLWQFMKFIFWYTLPGVIILILIFLLYNQK